MHEICPRNGLERIPFYPFLARARFYTAWTQTGSEREADDSLFQIIQKLFRGFQIGGVETLGEPVVT